MEQEIKNGTYTIPEGFAAKIEDGKIIVEKAESDSEKIRKILVQLVQDAWDGRETAKVSNQNEYEACMSWLEKQKEQKSTELSEEDDKIMENLLRHFRNKTKPYWNGIAVKNIISYLEKQKDAEIEIEKAYKNADEIQYKKGFENGVASVKQKEQQPVSKPKIYDSMDDLIADALIEMVEESDLIDRDKKNRLVWIERHRAKPAEWSEEDLQHKSWILEFLADGERKLPSYAADFRAAYNWLKSLRPQPHWKPSEEQMGALKYALGEGGKFDKAALESLYEQLKKL